MNNTGDTEKRKAFDNCMLGKDISLSEDENRRICDCWAEKIRGLQQNRSISEAGANAKKYDSCLQHCKAELVKK